ncbi:MAG: glycosyl transferase [Actinobacteria bacterium]|nr:glycosyl transferase [Actinomycetota bacterium]
MNKYGYFDDDSKEYVIKKPDTPLPWINYIGFDKYFGIISNTAGGYSFYQDARFRRLTRYRYNNVPVDTGGRYIYIKDNDVVWNPGWKPVCSSLDEYSCRHGLGYTIIKGQKNGVEAEVTYFVPLKENMEIWNLKLANNTNKNKDIILFSFVEFCLWDAMDDMTNFQRNLNTGEVEIENGTIFHKTEYRERRNHYAYFTCSQKINGFDTSRDAFIGNFNGFANPVVVEHGKCTNSIVNGWYPVGVHQVNIELAPGQKKNLHFILGYIENKEDEKFSAPNVINKKSFHAAMEKYKNTEAINKAFDKLKRYWNELLCKFKVETENEHVNRMVNIWNQYQCMVTFNLSRSASFFESGIGRGMGYRDSNQDLLGFVHMIPERSRQRILEIAGVQLSDGTCYHQYQPLTGKGNKDVGGGFNDDPLWLIVSTCSYIKETGDYSILDGIAGHPDIENSKATLLDHLFLSIEYTLKNLGPHKLPLMGHADWNDCLNLNCFSKHPGESFQTYGDRPGGVAESVMIAGLFLYACRELIELLRRIDLNSKVDKLEKSYKQMNEAVEKYGWDGEWFLRAYDYYGEKIGSRECEEGKIFIEPQGWCIMGGAGLENGMARKALKGVEKYLATPDGIILNQPAYSRYYLNLGEISSYPPGYKENAGIFCHNNPWISIAETILGNGDKALDYYLRICPSAKGEAIEIYRCEPYCYAQMIAGRDAPSPGEAKNSWLTGTAAWCFVNISQAILGIKPDYDGLLIDPCIPGEWKEYNVKRFFRGIKYNITVKNPDGVNKGVKSLSVNGKLVRGNLIPLNKEEKEVQVSVILGD